MRIAGCILMMGIMLAAPLETADAARDAIRTWGIDVVPSLFPYMVLCRMLMAQLHGTRIPVRAVSVLISLLGGSPSGAAALSSLAQSDALNLKTLFTLAALTGTISPMFMWSTVRIWMNDEKLTNALFAAHFLGALLAAVLVYRFFPRHQNKPIRQERVLSENAAEPIASSVTGALGVGGCIVFFSVISAGIRAMLPDLPIAAQSVMHALLEIAGGIKSLAGLECSSLLKGIVSASVCGFSGLSMLAQNHLFLKTMDVKLHHLCCIGLLRAGCSALLMAVILLALL